MGIWLGPRGGSVIQEGDFSYDGTYIFTSNGKDWELALLDGNASSLVFTKNPGKVDMFLVAGGKTGGASDPNDTSRSAYNGPSKGGDGGDGGECVTVEGIPLTANTNYSVTIGASDNNTSIVGARLSYTAVSGSGSKGGIGGEGSYSQGHRNATPGDDGIFAYGKDTDTLMTADFIGHRFGPGGGGAGSMVYNNQNNNSLFALGGESNGPNHEFGKGGEWNEYRRNGTNGYANHGQGGGGAYFYWIATGGGRSASGTPGAGGTGILFIRNAR